MTSSSPSRQESTPFYWHDAEYGDRHFQIHGRTLFAGIVLFSAVLLLVFVFLYVRRVCLLELPQPGGPPLPRYLGRGGGLDPAAIRSLPVVLCQREAGAAAKEKEEERECCICLGGFEDGDKVKVLPPCRHCYHCECVDRWLSNESSCPLCRVSIRVDSSVSVTTA